jgi:hypothetical protein
MKHSEPSESLGVWALSIVRQLKYLDTEHFESWICFRLQAWVRNDLRWIP